MNSKESESNSAIRIGMVNYINTAPIYEVWKRTVTDERFIVVEDQPAVLNRMLASEKIDLGFVSSYEYCARPEKYRILRDLSISSTGPVGSVFLFSNTPMEQLDNTLVLLSNQSETSVCLVKIILEEFIGIQPQYIVGEVFGNISNSCQAVLAIGDDALRLVSDGMYAYQFDLGEIWNKQTGLPFVFSVCVVREEFCREHGSLVEEVQEALVSCREQGKKEMSSICSRVAPRIPMDSDACYSYLRALEYDLCESKCLALEKFFSYLIDRGEAGRQALPLRFYPALAQKI
ncbi:menaquinone biosynthetic enzyme MqnA/MqnD family protein [Desulfopila inferna]|uniref:menaquinone biosynthetic enzyme MqnA/MqnD family protein n=1 Tax=Desulfopila inferna TaxID=468528 RepID=UPI0019623BC1|nr:menaquinone biosynthesis protein [Desulfopila inferna]MBM9603091.1 menaquinone biosynthesis protein [Desulfopila inferna]